MAELLNCWKHMVYEQKTTNLISWLDLTLKIIKTQFKCWIKDGAFHLVMDNNKEGVM